MNEYKNCNLKYNILIPLFYTCTLTVFAPLEMYATNVNEFWFDIYCVLPGLLVVTIAVFVFLAIANIISMLNIMINRVLLISEFSIAILLYLSGNFMNVKFAELNGESINWELYTSQGITTQTGLAGVQIVALLLLYKFGYDRFMHYTSYVIEAVIAVQVITLVIVIPTSEALVAKSGYFATDINYNNYSSTDNYNVLVLDTFDSRVFNELLESEEGQKYADILSDFTYYKNTAGVFTLTDFSIPQILTGEKYLNQEKYGPFIEKAYKDSPFINSMLDDDWNVDIYTTVTIPQHGIREQVSNWKYAKFCVSDMKGLMSDYYRLVAFRYMPQCLRPLFEMNPDVLDEYKAVNRYKSSLRDDEDLFDWNNKAFYDQIDDMNVTTDDKMFHFYHIKGLHSSRNMDYNMEVDEDIKIEYDYVQTAEVCMKIIDEYLNRLKQIGVYDNSVIMIMADHGASDCAGQMQSPLLVIKGKNEKGELVVDERAVSYADLQDALIRLKNGEKANGVMRAYSSDEARFLYRTDFVGQLRSYSKNAPFIEYSIGKDAFDISEITETGSVFK